MSKIPTWISILFGLFSLISSVHADAAAKKAPSAESPQDGRRVIELLPIEKLEIELPDRSIRNFSEEYYLSLVSRLTQGGKFIVVDPRKSGIDARESSLPDFQWPGSSLPVATIRVRVDSLSFQTGLRGGKMFYGIHERFPVRMRNEFPLEDGGRPARWFGGAFDQKGSPPFDSRSGLDLGEGFQINILFAWLTVKHARYRSDAHLSLEIDAPFSSIREVKKIKARGEGFFFDVVAGYENYSAALTAARTDAMTQAILNSLRASEQVIGESLSRLPLVARLDAVTPDGTLLLGTGHDSQIRKGILFQSIRDGQLIAEVVRSNSSGSIARIVRGDLKAFEASAGGIFKQINEMPLNEMPLPHPKALVRGGPQLISFWTDLPRSNLGSSDFLRSLVEFIFLPYRIWRYFQYDQAYHAQPDPVDSSEAGDIQQWIELARREPWADRVGLTGHAFAGGATGERVAVAIVDSGLDYNHPVLHSSLWLNPSPHSDGFGHQDRYGWDFVSGDSRPYDDAYHGTHLASAVLMTEPLARLMPVKIFNPWGVTNSNSIVAAFQYAVDHGAKVILCGWSTRKRALAIEEGVRYAREHGVLVVAAAGDSGKNLGLLPEYPAALSAEYENVLTVGAVDHRDVLMSENGVKSNYGFSWVGITAPGKQVRVLEPRGHETRASSTGIAAALVAGAVARKLRTHWDEKSGPADWILSLQREADSIPGLMAWVTGGYRLRISE